MDTAATTAALAGAVFGLTILIGLTMRWWADKRERRHVDKYH